VHIPEGIRVQIPKTEAISEVSCKTSKLLCDAAIDAECYVREVSYKCNGIRIKKKGYDVVRLRDRAILLELEPHSKGFLFIDRTTPDKHNLTNSRIGRIERISASFIKSLNLKGAPTTIWVKAKEENRVVNTFENEEA
jgi:hypothetical protein